MEYKLYTWEDFEKDLKIIDAIVKVEKFKSIAGVAFGGLPLATTLKNKLGLTTRIVFASSYTDSHKRKQLKIKFGDLDKLISPVLVVDDITDSGNTLKAISYYLSSKKIKFKTLVLFYKISSKIEPDYRLNKVDVGTWVVFPWE